MSIPIKRFVDRVPGGMMTLPLAAGALLATFAPKVPGIFGSFTGALFTGSLPILAVFYVCIGATVSVRSLPGVLKKGGVLLGTKVLLGIAAGVLVGHLIGIEPVAAGWFSGFSTLAVVAAINDTNGGLYMALMNRFGRAEDAAAYSVMSLESGPFLTMLRLVWLACRRFRGKPWLVQFCRSHWACCSATSIPIFANSLARQRRCLFRSSHLHWEPLSISNSSGRRASPDLLWESPC